MQDFSAELKPWEGLKQILWEAIKKTLCCFFLQLFPCLWTGEVCWLDRKSPIMLDGLHNFILYSVLLRIYWQTEAHNACTHKKIKRQQNKGSPKHSEHLRAGSGMPLLLATECIKRTFLIERLWLWWTDKDRRNTNMTSCSSTQSQSEETSETREKEKENKLCSLRGVHDLWLAIHIP